MKELTKHRIHRESGVFTQRIWTDNFANVATREKQNLKPINGAVVVLVLTFTPDPS